MGVVVELDVHRTRRWVAAAVVAAAATGHVLFVKKQCFVRVCGYLDTSPPGEIRTLIQN